MPNIWMLDVLADLRRFAENEGLSDIATTFDVAGMVVARQLASHEETIGDTVNAYDQRLHRETTGSTHA